MASFNTPCVVILGVVKGRVMYVEVDSGRRAEEHVGVEVDSVEPVVGTDFLHGHLAVVSFFTTIVKAVALQKEAYLFDVDGLRPLPKRAVSVASVKAKEYGEWESVWNKPILLSQSSPTVAVGASRAGSILHINAVPTDVEVVKKAWATARVMRRAGDFNINCTCRLGLMPVELFARRGNRYIIAKFYLNLTSPRSKKAFFIMGEGGNLLERKEVDLYEAEVVAYEFINKL
ncbi:MAG: hypothetical protein ABWK05_00110 [Pyrobaculum sp.]